MSLLVGNDRSMTVVGIDNVEFIVDDTEHAAAYLDRWGLCRAQDGDQRFVCADGSSVSYTDNADAAVENRPYRTIREVTWGVSDAEALATLQAELARDRDVTVDADGTLHTLDNAGLAIGLRVTVKQPIDAKPTLFNTPGAPARIDVTAPFYDRAVPQEISHIVLGVSDLAANEAFYREKLGFNVSDRYRGRGVFLRGPAIGHHHNLFLLDDGAYSFNHLAFKVRDIHEVIGGGQSFARDGAETLTGPGRHYASSGCFWYFKSPFGGAMEYVADEDQLTPAWQPSELEPSPARFSEWAFHNGGEMGALKKH